AVGRRKTQGETADGHARVRDERVAARHGQAADHGRATGGEHGGRRPALGRAIAFEMADDADSLGMIAPVAGMAAAVGLQGIDRTVRGQALRIQPAAHESERGARCQDNGADRAQAQTDLPGAERPGIALRSFRHKAPWPWDDEYLGKTADQNAYSLGNKLARAASYDIGLLTAASWRWPGQENSP